MGKFDVIQWTTKSNSSTRDRQPVYACFGLYPKIYSPNKLIYKAAIVGDDLEKPEVGVVKARRFRPGTERYWQGELDQNRYASEIALLFTDQTLAARIEIVDQYIAPLHQHTRWDKVCLKMKPRYFRRLMKFEIVLIETAVRKFEFFNNDKVLEAFSHFSYSESSGERLIYDFKGNRTIDGRYLLLTPEILTHKYDIHKWFEKHTCNEICGKLRRPAECSQPDKVADINTNSMFYDFENDSKPPSYQDEMSKEYPKDSETQHANFETTFGAKSCDGTYSVVTALVHSEVNGKALTSPVIKNKLTNLKHNHSYPDDNISHCFENKSNHLNDSDGVNFKLNDAGIEQIKQCETTLSDIEDKTVQNVVFAKNEYIKQDEITMADHCTPCCTIETPTLVTRQYHLYSNDNDREKAELLLLDEGDSFMENLVPNKNDPIKDESKINETGKKEDIINDPFHRSLDDVNDNKNSVNLNHTDTCLGYDVTTTIPKENSDDEFSSDSDDENMRTFIRKRSPKKVKPKGQDELINKEDKQNKDMMKSDLEAEPNRSDWPNYTSDMQHRAENNISALSNLNTHPLPCSNQNESLMPCTEIPTSNQTESSLAYTELSTSYETVSSLPYTELLTSYETVSSLPCTDQNVISLPFTELSSSDQTRSSFPCTDQPTTDQNVTYLPCTELPTSGQIVSTLPCTHKPSSDRNVNALPCANLSTLEPNVQRSNLPTSNQTLNALPSAELLESNNFKSLSCLEPPTSNQIHPSIHTIDITTQLSLEMFEKNFVIQESDNKIENVLNVKGVKSLYLTDEDNRNEGFKADYSQNPMHSPEESKDDNIDEAIDMSFTETDSNEEFMSTKTRLVKLNSDDIHNRNDTDYVKNEEEDESVSTTIPGIDQRQEVIDNSNGKSFDDIPNGVLPTNVHVYRDKIKEIVLKPNDLERNETGFQQNRPNVEESFKPDNLQSEFIEPQNTSISCKADSNDSGFDDYDSKQNFTSSKGESVILETKEKPITQILDSKVQVKVGTLTETISENSRDLMRTTNNSDFLNKYNLQDFVDASDPRTNGCHFNNESAIGNINNQPATSQESKSPEQISVKLQKPLYSSLRSGKRSAKAKSVKFADNVKDENNKNCMTNQQIENGLRQIPPVSQSVTTLQQPMPPKTTLLESFSTNVNFNDPNWQNYIPCECCDNENITGRE